MKRENFYLGIYVGLPVEMAVDTMMRVCRNPKLGAVITEIMVVVLFIF